MMTSTPATSAPAITPDQRWRTRDIVVASVIGVAFGVVFWAWNLTYAAAEPVFAAAPPLRDLMYGVWLIPAVLAPLIIRKPGAALFAEMVAAGVSALLGCQWSVYYPTISTDVQLVRLVAMALSAALIAAGGSLLLYRSLRKTGVLDGFPA